MKKFFTLIALVVFSYASMAQWLPQASGFSAASRGITDIHALNDSVVWAAAYDGTDPTAALQEFTRTTDGGETWVPGVITGAEGSSTAMIYGINADTAYAAMYIVDAGATQGIFVTRDGGLTWEKQMSAPYNNAASFTNVVHFFDDTTGFAQGDPIDGEFELYTTTDGGETWVAVPGDNIPDPLVNEWGVVGYYSAVGDTLWFGTNRGRIYRTPDRGMTWEAFATSLGNVYVDIRMATAWYGLAQDKGANTTGTFAETFDGGETWNNIASVGPTLSNDYTHVPGTGMTWVATGSDTDPPSNAGIAYSFDGGHTWDYFLDTEGFQFLATDFVSPTVGWVGGFNQDATTGGMYRFNGDLAASTNDLPAVENLRIFPNPVTDVLNITGDSKINHIQIVNLAGQVVYTTPVNGNVAVIRTSSLTKGLYLLNVISDKGIDTEKISIK